MIIPKEIKTILKKIEDKKFEAFVVGGCVRDLLRKEKPKDWDITTNAKPDDLTKIFKKSYLDNKFGTVTVLTGAKEENLKEVEITPYRIDEQYSDKRHPDKVHWAKTIEEDLARRDFTVNAMAADSKMKIIDPFSGQEDLKSKIIKTVGDAEQRFSEDALRMMRAVRFASTLDFEINKETSKAIKNNASWLKAISKERIRDELIKIVMSDKAAEGIDLLRELNLLKHIVPELEEGYKVGQNKHHIYDIYDHSILSLKYAAKKKFNMHVRFAALLHDIGKPKSKRGEGPDSTFYNHEVIGAKMTCKILTRLRFSKKDIEKIAKLVRYHLFYYNVDEVGESSVRRLVRQAGPENMEELLEVRMCDRIGSGCPKAEPYKLRHLKYLIEKTAQDPISVKKLKISGGDVMEMLKLDPGPKVGQILDILLGHVLESPEKNKKSILKEEIKKINDLSDSEIKKLAQKARKEREAIETKRDKMTKKKYWVT